MNSVETRFTSFLNRIEDLFDKKDYSAAEKLLKECS